MNVRVLSPAPESAQVAAADPDASVFVSANAGAGKTSTLVQRVARLLLKGARPEAILCVTYTKAAAAEMQRRLFGMLGDWAIKQDAALAKALADIGERTDDLGAARALFARALETPGGIKITTIHACCERLLRRFPLEAGVSPRFEVLDDAAARAASAQARDDVARAALANPDGPLGRAYAFFSVELDYRRFHAMFDAFETERRLIARYVRDREAMGGYGSDVWRRCGFDRPTPADELERRAVGSVRWGRWARAAQALLASARATDRKRGAAMRTLGDGSAFAELWAIFRTEAGAPRKSLATSAVDPRAREWLLGEQRRLEAVCDEARAARIAEATCHALHLAICYAGLYGGAKDTLGALDFGDLIEGARELLTTRADAAWVLFKLDGGLDHVLLDEAQDTGPDQWEILRLLSAEFFSGQGAGVANRTVFAVGDEKQSIFSFQGAAPERLAAETQRFEAMVRGAGRRFRQIPLQSSWRSTPEILSFVDAVLADPVVASALRPAGDAAFPIRHQAIRTAAGAVDIWPLEAPDPDEEAADPWAPVDARGGEGAGVKLARRIAEAVTAMVRRGEAVADKRSGEPRAMGYGDVLILVRRRNALFHEIIRALKMAGAPVGGADRLKLSEHIAFQDLLALGRLARFAADDLTLAALLRSPFCEVDEQALYDLAHGRDRPLWAVLQARAGERREWGEAAEFLAWARREAETQAPFDFYGRVLARLDARGVSIKGRLLARLGREAEDAIDAFLAEVLAAERRGVVDLERLVAELAMSEIEVKREHEDSEAGEVRVMTVHGAKGLEAPVVILPDTTTRATAQGGPLLSTADGGFLWAPRKADDCPASAEARAARDLACQNESLRLLYVALTRAQDRLIICGVATQDQYFRGSWREVVEAAFDAPAISERTHEVALDGTAMALRFGADPKIAAPAPVALASPVSNAGWAFRLAPAEPAALRRASPSRLEPADQTAAPSPLARTGGLGRYRRGELIHRLLQLLPDLDPRDRPAAAERLLAGERDLAETQREEMAAAALGVLGDARFSSVFGPGSRAEVALAGRVGASSVVGRVDRLLVEPGRVLVADFKTNRPAPDHVSAVDPAYVRQMALYWALLARIYPGRRIEAALVWTDGPKLMVVPENVMTSALDALAGAG